VTGKLTVGSDGRLRGPASISYNDPWPCPNHGSGSGAMNGLVQHTMVGTLASAIKAFNTPSFQASAFFGVDETGHIHQFIGVGLGLYSWAQVAGNRTWYSCEFADNGNPNNPMTDAQLTAGAQILECLSAFAGFPLQEANSPSERGLGVHYMGGGAWGGHTCPDLPPKHVRSSQRPEIIARAKAIRAGQGDTVAAVDHVASGTESLADIAEKTNTDASTILRLTAVAQGRFDQGTAEYIDEMAAAHTAPMAKGSTLKVHGS